MTSEELKAKVGDILSLDDPSNYGDADDACDGVLSEIEDDCELTPEQASEVNEMVAEWFDKE